MRKLIGKKIPKRGKQNTYIDEILESVSKKRLIKLNKNEHLYRQNEPIRGIFYLINGKIKVVQKDKDDKYNVLYSVRGPDIIGLSTILCDEYYTNSAYSVEESNILFIPKKDFMDVLAKKNEVAIDMMKLLCEKIDKTESKIPQISI